MTPRHAMSTTCAILAAVGLCGWAGKVQAEQAPGETLIMPPPIIAPLDAASGDMPPEHLGPPELQAPLYSGTAIDDAFPAFVDTLFDRVGSSLDAAVAEDVLAAIGRYSGARMATLTAKAKAIEVDPFHAKPPPALDGDAPDATWDSLTNHNFGSSRLLAVGVSQRVQNFSSLNTNVSLRHKTGPVDVQVKVSGNQALNMAQSMSVSYDSVALLGLSQNLSVGLAAKGSLGRLGALTPAQDQEAGPIARLKLFGNGTNVSAETGYTFRTRQEEDPALNRFHAKLNLNVKL